MLAPIILLLICNIVLAYEGENLHYYDLEKAEEYFEWFVKKHEKSYDDKFEEKRRLEIFRENLKTINERNAAEETPVYGINLFADLSYEEFAHQYTGLNLNESLGYDICQKQAMDMPYVNAPENFDWRSKQVVSPVKNQKTCPSCWAFASAGNVESLYAIKYKQKIDLSPQQLVDCDTSNHGCIPGNPISALSYIISNGLQSEHDYPYQNVRSRCRYNPNKVIARLRGCFNYFVNEEAMKHVLVQTGPLVVAVDSKTMHVYYGGIMKNCACIKADHAVLLVGYGQERGSPYWIIKNSWGAQWGEEGYFRIPRGSNACCVTSWGVASGVIA